MAFKRTGQGLSHYTLQKKREMSFSLFIILPSLITAAQFSFSDQSSTSNTVVNCLKTICNRYCDQQHNLLFSLNTSAFSSDSSWIPIEETLKKLHSESYHPTMIYHVPSPQLRIPNIKSVPADTQCLMLVVNLTDGADNFTQHIEILEQSRLWNNEAKHFVVISETVVDEDNAQTVRHITEILWRRYVLNVIVVIFTEALSVIHFYTWKPFSISGKCGTSMKHMSLLDTWIMQKEGYFMNSADLFPQKVPHKLLHCPIRVSTFDWEPYVFPPEVSVSNNSRKYLFKKGTEPPILQAVADYSGYDVEYLPPPPTAYYDRWGGRAKNGTWFGSLGYLVTNDADVSYAGYRPDIKEFTIVDITIGHSRDVCRWYIQSASILPRWKSIFIIFNLKTWVCIAISYIFTTIILLLTEERKKKNFVTSALNSLSILIGMSLRSLPKTTRLRLITVLWVYCSLILSSGYQSLLVGFLTYPGYEKQITSVEELVQSDLHYGSWEFYLKLYTDKNDYITRQLVKNYEICDQDYCLEKLVKEDDYVLYFCASDIGFLLNKLYFLAQGRKTFTHLKNGGMSFEVTFYLRKFSPYTKRFNTMISRILQSGIFTKWESDLKREEALSAFKREKIYSKENKVVLSLIHFEGAFYIFFSGISVSFIIFMGEIIYKQLYSNVHTTFLCDKCCQLSMGKM